MGGRAAATTRAKTSTSTWPAPARDRARAQASTVAPEVSTSSINPAGARQYPIHAPWRPGRRLARYRRAPFRLAHLLRRRPHTFEPPVDNGHAGQSRDDAGESRRLIEAPRPLSPPMQGHRDERFGIGKQFAACTRHPLAHRRHEVEAVAIFEAMDERARNVVVTHGSTRPVIGRRVGNRFHRQ